MAAVLVGTRGAVRVTAVFGGVCVCEPGGSSLMQAVMWCSAIEQPGTPCWPSARCRFLLNYALTFKTGPASVVAHCLSSALKLEKLAVNAAGRKEAAEGEPPNGPER